MNGQELIDYTRNSVLKDTALPPLWSDDLLLLYLNEAERLFARRTHALLDDSSPFTSITTQVGVPEYSLNKSILFVYSAIIPGQSRPLQDRSRAFFPNYLPTSVGMPRWYAMNEADKTVRFMPVPEAVYTVALRVARLPLRDIDYETSPEIPEQYHVDLAEYVAARCLNVNDVEGINVAQSDMFMKSWGRRLSEAKNEYARYRMGMNATAARSWTGKRNGGV